MAEYSVAEAKNHLPKLLDRAVAGETITITRRGKPIARIVPETPRGMSIDLAWLERVRIKPRRPATADEPTLVELMRNDSRY